MSGVIGRTGQNSEVFFILVYGQQFPKVGKLLVYKLVNKILKLVQTQEMVTGLGNPLANFSLSPSAGMQVCHLVTERPSFAGCATQQGEQVLNQTLGCRSQLDLCWASPVLGWVTIQGKAGAGGDGGGGPGFPGLPLPSCRVSWSPLSSTPKIEEVLRHRTQKVCSMVISPWVSPHTRIACSTGISPWVSG